MCDRRSSGDSMPAAWDQQEPLPAPGQPRYQQHHPHQRSSPPAGAAGSPAVSSDAGYPPAAEEEEEEGAGGGVVLAVSNPLYGSSRPGTAQGLQSLQDALPPKRSLRRSSQSESESGPPAQAWDLRASSSSLAAAAAERRRRRQPEAVVLRSLGSLGSGFGGGRLC